MHGEIEFVLMVQWLRDFFLDCLSRDIERITHSLVMMQPDSPMTCDCEKNRYCALTEHDKLFHANHTYYNSVIWRMLYTMDLIPEIRVILQHDMSECNDAYGREWGEITSHKYAKSLLDNLVTPNPNPEWTDPKFVWEIKRGNPAHEPDFHGSMYVRKESHE